MSATTTSAPIAPRMDRHVKQDVSAWPIDARTMMELISRNPHFGDNRRRGDRKRYNVAVNVTYSDVNGQQRTTEVYTRNISPGHVAFICQFHSVPGDALLMSFPLPDGRRQAAQGTVRRCRQFFDGWFDCVVRFSAPPKPKERRWLWFGSKNASN